MKRTLLAIFLALEFSSEVKAQELFPLNEAASTVPKGVLGVRIFSETFKEVKSQRGLLALRLMYGITPRVSLLATISVSNHHNTSLPPDLITHTHVGSQTYYFTHNIQKGVKYPYLFNGLHLFAKYRFVSVDRKNEHLRVAIFGEWSNIYQAHDESEPNLMEDTRGYGGGLIITRLKNRFAASLTVGGVFPSSFSEMQKDVTGGPDLATRVHYGNALKYNLSFGYLLFPRQYHDYSQSAWNIYLEVMGKSYESARVIQNGQSIELQSLALVGGNYIEVYPGIQRIINSNLRIDFATGFNLVNRSYVHFYPVFMLAVQRYFYFRT